MYDRITRIWTVENGDTLSGIAKIIYGDYRKYPRIQKANSELVKNPDLIFPGWKLYIPPAEDAKRPVTRIIDLDENPDFLVRVNDKDLNFISALKLKSGINQGSRTCAFSMLFNQEDGFKYGDSAQVFVEGELFIDGILLRPEPSYSKQQGSVISWQIGTKVNYILNSNYKSTISNPASWENITLKDLITNVLKGFEIDVQFSEQSIAQETFKKIGIGRGETIFSFVAKIIQQKGYLIQGLATGDLYAAQANTAGLPIASFDDANTIQINCSYDTLAGEYRATNQKKKGGGSKTATNDFINKNVFKQFQKDSGFDGDLQSFVDFKQSKEFAEALQAVISTRDIRSPGGNLWKSNELVSIQVPELGIPDSVLFLIDSLSYDFSKRGKNCELTCVLPETRSGKLPTWLPFL